MKPAFSFPLILVLLSASACVEDKQPFHVVQTRADSDRAERAAKAAAQDAEKCREQHHQLEAAVEKLRNQTAKLETTAAACER